MPLDEKKLTKGQIRKLNALRKSIGDKLGEEAFSKWLKEQVSLEPKEKTDPVSEKILEALKPLQNDKTFKLGNKGYIVKRARGKGAAGFIVEKVTK
ncbi:MAG: hypothetical protein CMM59_13255 [Rhodospirillaceae bacterium]|nr:hypothetical protein [Rhodospirillaceae bacterium]